MQKGAGANLDIDLLAVALDRQQIERLDRRLGLTGDRAEAVEVVVSDQDRSRLCHCRLIERHRHMPDLAAVEGGRRAAIEDAVAIAPPGRREAGVKAWCRKLDHGHDDGMRLEVEVERAAHLFGGLFVGEVEVRHLATRMHAGIGAPGAPDVHALSRKSEDRILEGGLDRRAGVLALPADERAAVILDADPVTRHRISSAGFAAAARPTGQAGRCRQAGRSRAKRRRPAERPCPAAAA